MTKIVNFRNNPRDYALEMVEEKAVNPVTMLTAALLALSNDEVRDMLDRNEWSPRFDDPDEDDDEDEDEDDEEDDADEYEDRNDITY